MPCLSLSDMTSVPAAPPCHVYPCLTCDKCPGCPDRHCGHLSGVHRLGGWDSACLGLLATFSLSLSVSTLSRFPADLTERDQAGSCHSGRINIFILISCRSESSNI